MKNRFTINESEKERILSLHEQQKPGLLNRIKGAVQGFKNPTVAPPTVTPTASVAPPTVTSTATVAPPTVTPTATVAPSTSWATSADKSTVCQTKPSQTKSPQLVTIQETLNKVFSAKPESKTIMGCGGKVLFPLTPDGKWGPNTAKAVLIAMNYKKMSGGQPQQGQPQQGQPQQGQPQQGQPQQGQPQQGQQLAGGAPDANNPALPEEGYNEI